MRDLHGASNVPAQKKGRVIPRPLYVCDHNALRYQF